jgi:hypothetical protein
MEVSFQLIGLREEFRTFAEVQCEKFILLEYTGEIAHSTISAKMFN